MPERNRFRIMDLVVLVAAVAVATASTNALQSMTEADQGKTAFWIVILGVALVGYLAARFARTPEVRLIVVGLAVAFAGAADVMFLDAYMDAPTASVVVGTGLGLASLVLLGGGVALGLRPGRWDAPTPNARAVDGPLARGATPHFLDQEESP